MLEYIKKGFLTGVGMALRSKTEIEEMAKEFADQSKMDQDEAKEFLNSCQEKYDEAREGIDKRMEAAIEKVMARLDLPTRSDIKALNTRIDELSEKIKD